LNQGTVTTGSGDIDNPYLLVLPNGRILCTFRNHSKDAAGTYTYFRITICYSDDNGVTWQYLSEPASDPGPVNGGVSNGNWEPFLRLSSVNTNQIQLYYSREAAADNQDSLMRTSTDGGLTWSLATTISGNGVVARDGMVGVTTLPAGGGNLIAVFESKTSNSPFSIWTDTSSDDGVTWDNRKQIYTATGSNNNAGAPQIVNVGGTLVVCCLRIKILWKWH
jgi:Neuraminidase (sialidase)